MKKIAAAVVGVVVSFVAVVALAATLNFQSFSSTAFVPASVAAGSPIAVGTLSPLTVTMESVGTATYQIQLSLDPAPGGTPAAASWQNEGAALTASGSLSITKPCAWLRVNTTAYTSGSPTLRVAGLNRQ